MGLDSYLPLKKSGQCVIDRNLPYRFLRGQPLKCLFPVNAQNEIQLLAKFLSYSWLGCLLFFWLRNAPLVKVMGNPISDSSLLLTSPCAL